MPSVRRIAGFSKHEWILFALGIGAGACLYLCFPEKWWKIYVTGFGLGFLFEASMDPLFTYCDALSGRHCVGNTDVNFLFPFGWIFIVGLVCVIAEKIFSLATVVGYAAAGFIAGNIMEFVFYKSKWWVYNYDAPWIGAYKPFVPRLPVFGVPLQVIVGYFNVGVLVFCIVRVLC